MSDSETTHTYDAVVIGCGGWGLAALKVLRDMGLDVLVADWDILCARDPLPALLRRLRARGSVDCGRCIQNGPPEQQSDVPAFHLAARYSDRVQLSIMKMVK